MSGIVCSVLCALIFVCGLLMALGAKDSDENSIGFDLGMSLMFISLSLVVVSVVFFWTSFSLSWSSAMNLSATVWWTIGIIAAPTVVVTVISAR